MSIVGYIIIGIIIFIVVVVYLLFLLSYIGSAKGYREANRTDAKVIEDLGDLRYAVRSEGFGTPQFRTFHKYKVSFLVNGEEYIEEADLKNCYLKVGEITEIRYSVSKKERFI